MNQNNSIPTELQNLTLTRLTSGQYDAMFPNTLCGLNRDLQHSSNFDDFNKSVEKYLDRILARVQKHPYARRFDCEDRITIDIVNGFQLLNFHAEHEASQNGNVDVTVSQSNTIYWLGEAKIDRDSGYLLEGFRQLVDRYLTDSRDKIFPTMLIYCKTRHAHETKKNWLKYLKRPKLVSEFSINIKDEGNNENYIVTSHRCKKSGKTVDVKHHFVSLFDCASDKNAKDRKDDKCPNCSKPYKK